MIWVLGLAAAPFIAAAVGWLIGAVAGLVYGAARHVVRELVG